MEVWIRDRQGRAIANYVPGRVGRGEGSFLYARSEIENARNEKKIDKNTYQEAVAELKAYRELNLVGKKDYEPKVSMILGELCGALGDENGDLERQLDVPQEKIEELMKTLGKIVDLANENSGILERITRNVEKIYRAAI